MGTEDDRPGRSIGLVSDGCGWHRERNLTHWRLESVVSGRHGNSPRNLSSSAWKVAGVAHVGAWLPPGMTTFRPERTEFTSRSACSWGINLSFSPQTASTGAVIRWS